jgi:hypothetical protein
MNLPPPTQLSDEEFIENLRMVVGGTLDAMLLNPDKVDLIRQGVSGLLIDAQGVMLFRRADLVDLAVEELVEEIELELGKDL